MKELTNWIYSSLLTQENIATGCAAEFVAYLGIVRYVRYKNINTIKTKYTNPQQVLNDAQVAQDIFDTTIPIFGSTRRRIGIIENICNSHHFQILASTGEFGKYWPRRTEDTELLLCEITDTYVRVQKQFAKNPNKPQKDIDEQWKRPEKAVRRLNEIHGKYNILNDDYLHTLSLVVSEPTSWINRYEWRELDDEREINAMFLVWYDVGVAMNIRNIPDTPQKLLDFQMQNRIMQKITINTTPSNWKCGEPTIRLLLSQYIPSLLCEQGYRFSLRLLPSLLDAADTAVFQLPYPESKLITWILKSTLLLRAFFIRHFMLPRSTWLNRTPFYANEEDRFVPELFIYKPHISKEGYVISELGPEKFIKQCPF